MTTKLTFSLFLFVSTLALAQDPKQYADLIEPNALKDNLSIIASDAMEGRMTGSRGQKMAAAFIANHFESLGLKAINKGSYYQQFGLYSYRQGMISLTTATKTFDTRKDLVLNGNQDSGGPKPIEIVFIGSGSDAEIEQVDVKGKVALVVMNELAPAKIRPLVAVLKSKGCFHMMFFATVPDAEYSGLMYDVQNEVENGTMSLQPAKADDMQWYFVSKAVIENLYGSVDKLKAAGSKKNGLKKLKPVKATITAQVTEDIVKTENVMGFLEGGDKKNEVVLITSHYDHVGLTGESGDRVFNGADDDGSGTVTVLQLATAFAKAKKDGHGPRRSILFMTVTGEELGLFGSEYYTDTDPVVPLSQTVVDLNIDMVGRWDPEHAGKEPYVYIIGADKLSSELQEVSVANNEKYTKLAFDYTYNDENHPTNLYQRSDHWNFAKHRVPIIFYFDGIHEDYHKATDEVEKIDFDILAKRGQCVFYTAWDIANREERLRIDK